MLGSATVAPKSLAYHRMNHLDVHCWREPVASTVTFCPSKTTTYRPNVHWNPLQRIAVDAVDVAIAVACVESFSTGKKRKHHRDIDGVKK